MLAHVAASGTVGHMNMLGLEYTGNQRDILYLTGLYERARNMGASNPQNTYRTILATEDSISVSLKVPADHRKDPGMPANRVTFVRGWVCDLPEAQAPKWLIERATWYAELEESR